MKINKTTVYFGAFAIDFELDTGEDTADINLSPAIASMLYRTMNAIPSEFNLAQSACLSPAPDCFLLHNSPLKKKKEKIKVH